MSDNARGVVSRTNHRIAIREVGLSDGTSNSSSLRAPARWYECDAIGANTTIKPIAQTRGNRTMDKALFTTSGVFLSTCDNSVVNQINNEVKMASQPLPLCEVFAN